MTASALAVPELLCLITSHLDYRDYKHCVLVSKEWNAAFSPLLWSTVHVCGSHKAHCILPCAKALSRLGSHVHRVYAPRFLNSAGYLFYQHLIQHCPHLEEVHAYVGSKETWEMLLLIVQGPPPSVDQHDKQAQRLLDQATSTSQSLSLLMHGLTLAHPTAITTLDLEIEEERGFSVCNLLEHTPQLEHLSLNITIGLSLATLDNVLTLCPKLDSLTLQCESYEYLADGTWSNPLHSPPLALRTLHLRGRNAYDIFAHHLRRIPKLESVGFDLLGQREAWPSIAIFCLCPRIHSVHFVTATLATSSPSSPKLQELPTGHVVQDDRAVQMLLERRVPSHRLRSLRLETTGSLGIEAIVEHQIRQLASLEIGRITQIKADRAISDLLVQSAVLERVSIGSIMAHALALAVDEESILQQRFDLEAFTRPILEMGLSRDISRSWANKSLRTLKIPLSGPCVFHRQALDQQKRVGDGVMDVAGSVRMERDLLAALGLLEQLEELDLVCQECCTSRHSGKTNGKKPIDHACAQDGYEEAGGLAWTLRSGVESLAPLSRLRSVRIILAPSPPRGLGRRSRRVEPDVLEWMKCHLPHLTSFSYIVLDEKPLAITDLEAREEEDQKVDSAVRQWMAVRRPCSGYIRHRAAPLTTIDMHFLPLSRKESSGYSGTL